MTPSVSRVSSRRPISRRAPTGWRQRACVASRAAAGLGGGYALAAGFTATVALLSSAPREEAAYAGAVPSFLLLAGAIVWAFTARSAARAWLGVGLPALALVAAAAWWLRHSVVATS